MNKRLLGTLLAVGLVAGLFSALPAKAAPPIPDKANVEDAAGDANAANDQGGQCAQGTCTPYVGDQSAGASIGAADILKVWFSNDAEKFNVHILTTFPPPNQTPGFGIFYRIHLNENCTWFQGSVQGNTYQAPSSAAIREVCASGVANVPGTILIETLDDGRGLTTLTFPIGSHAALGLGQTLTEPFATSRVAWGHSAAPNSVVAPQLDNTKIGLDYLISEPTVGGPPPPPEEPPGKGEKKGCKKGKGKKKGCKPKEPPPPPPPPGCAPYVPGEQGKDAKTLVVTDAATEAKPLVEEVDTEAGLGAPIGGVPDAESSVFRNIQVDSSAGDAPLSIRFEFDTGQDYDLYLNTAAGEPVASAAGFNQLLLIPGDPAGGNDTDSGGHSEADAEAIDGYVSADCSGYTLDIRSFTTEGGTFELKLWLGGAPPAAAAYEAVLGLI